MNILKHRARFFNRTCAHVPRQLRRLYAFGFWSLSGERVASMRGNARQVVANPATAKTKAWRLLKNRRWSAVMPGLLRQLNLVTAHSVICLDFSDFHGWHVLTFAVQTRRGRAVPVFFDLIRYPITKDSQNIFIVAAIERFVAAVNCRPKLVMDRGFACPHILKHLAQVRHPFVVRIRGIKHLRNWQWRIFKAKNTRALDQVVRGYTRRLRLIVSDDPSNGNEPWYLVTNDFISTRQEIIADYYHRFEIEEFFKDAKWLLGLEWVRFLKARSLANVLWFVLLGLWFAELVLMTAAVNAHPRNNHHAVSTTRRVCEALQREQKRLLFRHLGLQLPGLCT